MLGISVELPVVYRMDCIFECNGFVPEYRILEGVELPIELYMIDTIVE